MYCFSILALVGHKYKEKINHDKENKAYFLIVVNFLIVFLQKRGQTVYILSFDDEKVDTSQGGVSTAPHSKQKEVLHTNATAKQKYGEILFFFSYFCYICALFHKHLNCYDT